MEAFQNIPTGMKTLIDAIPWVTDVMNANDTPLPEHLLELMDVGKSGCCMTCGRVLESETIISLNGVGILAIYCSGQCETDMHVVGWLEEVRDDIVQQVNFRANSGADDDS